MARSVCCPRNTNLSKKKMYTYFPVERGPGEPPNLSCITKISLEHRRNILISILGTLPNSLNNLFSYSYEDGDRTSREGVFNFHLPKVNKSGNKYPLIEILGAWNRLPLYYKNLNKTTTFKSEIKSFLVEKYKNFVCTKTKCYSCT